MNTWICISLVAFIAIVPSVMSPPPEEDVQPDSRLVTAPHNLHYKHCRTNLVLIAEQLEHWSKRFNGYPARLESLPYTKSQDEFRAWPGMPARNKLFGWRCPLNNRPYEYRVSGDRRNYYICCISGHSGVPKGIPAYDSHKGLITVTRSPQFSELVQ